MRDKEKFLLIGGSGRSGTTILCNAMGRHPKVSNVPEWRFMTDPGGIIDFYNTIKYGIWTPYKYDESVKALNGVLSQIENRGFLGAVLGSSRFRNFVSRYFRINIAPRYSRFEVKNFSPSFKSLKYQLIENLVDYKSEGYWIGSKPFTKSEMVFSDEATRERVADTCASFLRSVADDVCRQQGAKYHLEKNTWNILCFHKTLELLPEAKLVHIVRDPRDVVASYSVQPWVPNDYIKSAMVYRDVMNKWEQIKKDIPRTSFLEVRLEDLTESPSSEYGRICEFWGIPWDDSLLVTKLSNRSFGRWKDDIPHDVSGKVCEILRPICKKYGYE